MEKLLNIFKDIEPYKDILAVECFRLKAVQIDLGLLVIPDKTNSFISFKSEYILSNKKIQLLYNNILDIYSNILFCDILISLSNVLESSFNSIFAFEKTKKIFYINEKKDTMSKSIVNLNSLLDYINDDLTFNNGIIIPVFYCELEIFRKLLNWCNIFNKKYKINKIVIISIYNFNNVGDYNILVKKFKETHKNQNLVYINLIDIYSYLKILSNNNVIDKETYNKINTFIDSDSYLNNTNSKLKMLSTEDNIMAEKILNIRKHKQTNICVSLENIENIENSKEVIRYVNLIGPYICAITINTNYIFNQSYLTGLKKICKLHNIILIDNKKLVIRDINEFDTMLSLFQHIDIISLNLDFMDKTIQSKLESVRKEQNPNASIIFYFDKYKTSLEKDIIIKQTTYFSKFCLGIIGSDETIHGKFTFVPYNNFNNLNDNFEALKQTDMIIIDHELFKSKKAVDIVKKINFIIFDSK